MNCILNGAYVFHTPCRVLFFLSGDGDKQHVRRWERVEMKEGERESRRGEERRAEIEW